MSLRHLLSCTLPHPHLPDSPNLPIPWSAVGDSGVRGGWRGRIDPYVSTAALWVPELRSRQRTVSIQAAGVGFLGEGSRGTDNRPPLSAPALPWMFPRKAGSALSTLSLATESKQRGAWKNVPHHSAFVKLLLWVSESVAELCSHFGATDAPQLDSPCSRPLWSPLCLTVTRGGHLA